MATSSVAVLAAIVALIFASTVSTQSPMPAPSQPPMAAAPSILTPPAPSPAITQPPVSKPTQSPALNPPPVSIPTPPLVITPPPASPPTLSPSAKSPSPSYLNSLPAPPQLPLPPSTSPSSSPAEAPSTSGLEDSSAVFNRFVTTSRSLAVGVLAAVLIMY